MSPTGTVQLDHDLQATTVVPYCTIRLLQLDSIEINIQLVGPMS